MDPEKDDLGVSGTILEIRNLFAKLGGRDTKRKNSIISEVVSTTGLNSENVARYLLLRIGLLNDSQLALILEALRHIEQHRKGVVFGGAASFQKRPQPVKPKSID